MYEIKDWNSTFENADTRKRMRLGWFLCPSGTDSAGYIELMSHGEEGIKAYAVFLAICQWSATCLPDVRGRLARSSGKPASTRQIAAAIRMPEAVVANAFELLSSEDVGWIVNDTSAEKAEKHREKRESAGCLPVICQSSASHLPQGEGEGEGEGKGKGKVNSPKSAEVDRPFEVDEQSWNDWRAARKAKRAGPITRTVLCMIEREAEAAGISLQEAIRRAAGSSWITFKAEYLQPLNNSRKSRILDIIPRD